MLLHFAIKNYTCGLQLIGISLQWLYVVVLPAGLIILQWCCWQSVMRQNTHSCSMLCESRVRRRFSVTTQQQCSKRVLNGAEITINWHCIAGWCSLLVKENSFNFCFNVFQNKLLSCGVDGTLFHTICPNSWPITQLTIVSHCASVKAQFKKFCDLSWKNRPTSVVHCSLLFLWTKVHQIALACAGVSVVCNAIFRLTMFCCIWEIFMISCEVVWNHAEIQCFWGTRFRAGGKGHPNFWPNFVNLGYHQPCGKVWWRSAKLPRRLGGKKRRKKERRSKHQQQNNGRQLAISGGRP